MTVRELPVAEWSRLAGTELERVAPLFTPHETRILVIEQDGQIVGTIAAWLAWHVDGLWIHPTYRRRGDVFRRLRSALQGWMQREHVHAVIAGSNSADMRAYLLRLHAVPLPEAFAYLREG